MVKKRFFGEISDNFAEKVYLPNSRVVLFGKKNRSDGLKINQWISGTKVPRFTSVWLCLSVLQFFFLARINMILVPLFEGVKARHLLGESKKEYFLLLFKLWRGEIRVIKIRYSVSI